MKSSKILAAAAFSILAAAGAQAETYDGVHALTSQRARSEVVSEAVLAARSPNPYAEGASSGVAPALLASNVDRARVRAQAVAAAHAPNQNLKREGFFNSEVPAAYKKPVLSFTRQASL